MMLGRIFLPLLNKSKIPINQAKCLVQKRNWTQQSMFIAIPPREKIHNLEKLLHALFMVVIWVSPVLYGLSNINVWRKKYGG